MLNAEAFPSTATHEPSLWQHCRQRARTVHSGVNSIMTDGYLLLACAHNTTKGTQVPLRLIGSNEGFSVWDPQTSWSLSSLPGNWPKMSNTRAPENAAQKRDLKKGTRLTYKPCRHAAHHLTSLCTRI